MRQRLVYKLLGRNINAWQLAGFVLANLFGMAIILVAVQFYADVVPLFTSGDSFMKPGQMVVAKRVSLLKTLGGKAPSFGQAEIDDLARQPFASRVAVFTPSLFSVVATIGVRDMSFSTEMFFESVPDEYVDVDLQRWHYSAGSGEVPIILPRNYLNLYNFGFATTRGLPAVSEGVVASVPIRLQLSGTAGSWQKTGRVVAFSRRLNTILVPQQFLDEANAALSPERKPVASRLIVGLRNPADERIAAYLQAHGLDTEADDADAARTASLLRLVVAVVLLVGVVIAALAFYVLLLSIFLLLQKHTEKIDTLLLIGHAPRTVGRPYCLLAFGLNSVVLLAAIALVMAARRCYLPYFGQLYPRFEASAFLPTVGVGVALFAVVGLLNFLAIRRKILGVWRCHY